MKIKIDPDISSFLPKASPERRESLRIQLVAEGCTDPLVIWKERGVLVDGHTRQELCEAEGIGFRTRELSFPDIQAVRLWMFDNQDNRRNWTDYERTAIALKLKNEIAARAAAKIQETAFPANATGLARAPKPSGGVSPVHARKMIAEAAGVSEHTVDNVERAESDAEKPIRELAKQGKISIATAATVSTLPADEQRQIAEQGPAAVKAKAANIRRGKANPPNDFPEPKPSRITEAEPWGDFNAAAAEIVIKIRTVAREAQKVLGLTADGGRTIRWNHFMSHAGTVGQMLDVAKNIESNLPAQLAEKQPGFIPVRQLKLTQSIKRSAT